SETLHPTTIALPEAVDARYVQVHLNGNSRNNGNHVYEIDVWGAPGSSVNTWESANPTTTTPTLAVGDWYAFKAAARNQAGWGPQSPISVGAPVISAPTAPTSPSVSRGGGYTSTETWWNAP